MYASINWCKSIIWYESVLGIFGLTGKTLIRVPEHTYMKIEEKLNWPSMGTDNFPHHFSSYWLEFGVRKVYSNVMFCFMEFMVDSTQYMFDILTVIFNNLQKQCFSLKHFWNRLELCIHFNFHVKISCKFMYFRLDIHIKIQL